MYVHVIEAHISTENQLLSIVHPNVGILPSHHYECTKKKCKKFLAFSSLEVRLLVDSSSCSNNKSYERQNRTSMGCRISLTRCHPRIGNCSNYTRHVHTYVNNSDNGHQASAKAVRVVQFFSIADSRTEMLHVLLSASNSHLCITRTYLTQPMWERNTDTLDSSEH